MRERSRPYRISAKAIAALMLIGMLAAACAPALAPAPVRPTDTPQTRPLQPLIAASPTAQPTSTEEPTSTSAPFVLDLTPLPTETALPTIDVPTEVSRPPVLAVWDGLPTYPAESDPSYYFRVSFDPDAWALTTDNYGLPALVHRAITNCIIAPTAGRGLPPNATVEHEVRRINGISYQIGDVSVNGVRQSVTYTAGDGRIYTAFQVSVEERPDQCLLEAETVLGTLTSIPISQATPIPTP